MARNRHYHTSRDNNEPEIIQEFRDLDCIVWCLSSSTEEGIPDLLVGCMGVWGLVEVKMPKGKLRFSQTVKRDICQTRGLPWFLVDHIDDVPAVVAALSEQQPAHP